MSAQKRLFWFRVCLASVVIAAVLLAHQARAGTNANEARNGKNLAQAIPWFFEGAAYYDGSGVPKDYTKAREWFLKAASQGEPDAQAALGAMYYQGEGGTKDYFQAKKW